MEQFLKLLHESKPAYRKQLLEKAPNDVVYLLSQCALNMLQGEMILTKQQKAKLKPHKEKIRRLASKRVSMKNKKNILQSGGLAPLLIPIVASMLHYKYSRN